MSSTRKSRKLFSKSFTSNTKQMLKRVDRLRIDLAEVIRIDAGLLVAQSGPQGVDVLDADLFGD